MKNQRVNMAQTAQGITSIDSAHIEAVFNMKTGSAP